MKSNYLSDLEREFYFVSDDEREQIIQEYEVHFTERIKDGATEAEVIQDLGTPKQVAIEYATELDLKYSSVEKVLFNTKRDSNLYFKSLKKKMHEIKREEVAKRNNQKAYVREEDNEHGDNSASSNNSNATTGKSNVIVRFFRAIINFIIHVLFLIKVPIVFLWKIFIKFTMFIVGICFAINALCMITIGLLTPFFISFTNYKFSIWLIFYGGIISLVVFFVTICLMCLSYFGKTIGGNHEQTT